MSEPKKKIVQIKVDRDLCIGAAACLAVMPETFELDQENKALIISKKGSKTSDSTNVLDLFDQDQEKLWISAEACPVRAIFLYDDNGNQIYPLI